MEDNGAEKRKPNERQMMQHPNSLLARTSKDKQLRQKYLEWKKQNSENAASYEAANRRGWV